MGCFSNKYIIRIYGGLGNQLFQICAGLYAAQLDPKSEIYLDLSALSKYETRRKLSVDFFIRYFPDFIFSKKLSLPLRIISKLRIARVINRVIMTFGFISSAKALEAMPKSKCRIVFIDGYFQDPLIPSYLLQEKKIFESISNDFKWLKDKKLTYPDKKCVGIHIRRGDFVSSKAASAVFKTISLNYYRQAVKAFGGDVNFLIFGDDASVVSEFSLEIGGVDISSYNLSVEEEFILLMLCDHYIIANSTFSWWASYLGWSEGKRVVAPRAWYKNDKRSFENPLLLPHFEYVGESP